MATFTIEAINTGGFALPLLADGVPFSGSKVYTVADTYPWLAVPDKGESALPDTHIPVFKIQNVFPATANAGNPSFLGETVAQLTNNPFFYVSLDHNHDNFYAWYYPYDVTLKLFFQTFRVKNEWSDGVTHTPLVGRAVPMGWRWEPPEAVLTGPTALDWGAGGNIRQNSEGYLYQLTDGVGVATYSALVGISIKYECRLSGTYNYYDFDAFPAEGNPFVPLPGSTTGGAYVQINPTIGVVNVSMYPYAQELTSISGHIFSQSSGPSDWMMDYAAAWDGSGNLSVSDPAIALQSYTQHGTVEVFELDEITHVNCNVTMGPYSGTSFNPIAALPNGSLLDNVRDGLDTLTNLPLLSTSPYGSFSPVEGPVHSYTPGGYRYSVTYTSKDSTHLYGLTFDTLNSPPDPFPVIKDYYLGGEVITNFYPVTATEIGGTGRIWKGKIWVHEDTDTILQLLYPYTPVETGNPLALTQDIDYNVFGVTVKDSSIHLYRRLRSNTDFTDVDTHILGANPAICFDVHGKDAWLFLTYESGPFLYLARNANNGFGPWSTNLIALGSHGYPETDTFAGILYVTYWRDGNSYFRANKGGIAAGDFSVGWNSEHAIVACSEQQVQFKRLPDNKFLATYTDGSGNLQVLTSTDNGTTWS